MPAGLSGTVHPARVLLTTDAVGGVWTYALDLAAALVATGTTVLLATLGPAPTAGQRHEAATAGVELVQLPHRPEWLAADASAVTDAGDAVAMLARRWRADLVHLNSPALAAASSFPCPVVAIHHSCVATWWAAVRGGPEPADFAWRTSLTRRGFAHVDALGCPTAAFAAATQAVYGLAHPPAIVRNGRAAPRAVSADVVLSDTFFTAGRLWDDGKGIAVLDRAAMAVDASVCAAGPTRGPEGSDRQYPHLTLLGSLDATSVRTHLNKRPIYVAPARYEPFGLAVLEAAQAGCPLLLADIPTFRELWGGAAAFVDATDADALAAGMKALRDDAPRRRELAAAATERATQYTIEAMVAATRALYATALHNLPARASA